VLLRLPDYLHIRFLFQFLQVALDIKSLGLAVIICYPICDFGVFGRLGFLLGVDGDDVPPVDALGDSEGSRFQAEGRFLKLGNGER